MKGKHNGIGYSSLSGYVVTALILKGKHNASKSISSISAVVTALILKGKHNARRREIHQHVVVTALILKGKHNASKSISSISAVVTALILKGKHNARRREIHQHVVVTALILKGKHNYIFALYQIEIVVTALILKGKHNDVYIFKNLTQEVVTALITWVLDLLPHFPNEAIKAIDAYFLANCMMLPDNCLKALSDSATIIRARYINFQHPKDVFWNLNPIDFEYLVASLYQQMGYIVSVTKSSYDGGIDVNAEKKEIGEKEKLIIQCKRYTKQTVSVNDVRNLLGVINDTKATKGILITTSKFSTESRKLENNNPSIELIDINDLMKLLNTYLGTYWIQKLEKIINEQKINHNYR